MAAYFGHPLQYLRDGVQVIELPGGNFTEMLLTDTRDSALVVFEARRYSRLAYQLSAKVEPPRDCRRLQLLRRWSHDEQDNEQVFN